MSVDSWFERVPKVELHVHLEGSIPHPIIWELIQKYGGDASVPDLESLRRRYEYRDFQHFIRTWLWQVGFIREYDDFSLIAEAVARDLASQNIRYVEAFFSPPDFFRHGLETQEIAAAIRRGLSGVPEVEVALVADLVRNYGPKQGARTLAEVSEVRELGVIGVGIGGAEDGYPPEPFEKVFAEARRLGLHTSAHAGEAAGPESIWGAIRALRVSRIGHGTRAIEDESLLDYLADHEITLELCPSSNVLTGVVPSIEHHPVRQFFERGIIVTVNTDDPKMFGNSLAQELSLLEDKHRFTRDEVRALILNALRWSWLPSERKELLIASFESDPMWVEPT